jgi:hypothetical protein
MESSYLGKRRLNGGADRETTTARAPAASSFLPAAAMGYEYGDAAEAADHHHLPRRVAAGEMDFFKKERKDAAAAAALAAFVPSSSDEHGIKEDDLTINVR